ncbi:hypothetical protein SmJEL517_g04826 [Synchytrium microbalum]|uniref:Cyclic nucleotide-binding domain-containing protein n=1 Tax=Synchytrium microbalum TaxID=1806994 RepID=A0A507BY11_9FUNG|nr:uncharacterized protein SmJEL517_g04826 [Synchytrium microbalum]TPX32001.1 hypothetical protein SmJEL517_g04826 [Synchytrium microbalum]
MFSWFHWGRPASAPSSTRRASSVGSSPSTPKLFKRGRTESRASSLPKLPRFLSQFGTSSSGSKSSTVSRTAGNLSTTPTRTKSTLQTGVEDSVLTVASGKSLPTNETSGEMTKSTQLSKPPKLEVISALTLTVNASRRGSADATVVDHNVIEDYIYQSSSLTRLAVPDDQRSLDQRSIASINELTTYAAFGVTLPSLSRKRAIAAKIAEAAAHQQPTSATIPIRSGESIQKDVSIAEAASTGQPSCAKRRWSLPCAALPPTAAQLGLPLTISVEPTLKKRHSIGSIAETTQATEQAATSTSENEVDKKSSNLRGILRNAPKGAVPPSVIPDPRVIADYSRGSSPAGSGDVDEQTPRKRTDGDVLGELPEFERLLKQKMTPAVFMSNEFIIRKHDIGKEMYFLSRGKVEVLSSDGKTQYSVINMGSFFGELGVLFDIPRTASIRALETCYCMVLTRKHLEDSLQGYPAISQRFRAVVEQRMQEVNAKRAMSRRVKIALPEPTVATVDGSKPHFNSPLGADCIIRVVEAESPGSSPIVPEENLWFYGHEQILRQSKALSLVYDAVNNGYAEGYIYTDSAGCIISFDIAGVEKHLEPKETSVTSLHLLISISVPVLDVFPIIIYDVYNGTGKQHTHTLVSLSWKGISAASRIVDMMDFSASSDLKTREICTEAAAMLLKTSGGWKARNGEQCPHPPPQAFCRTTIRELFTTQPHTT